MQAEFVEYSELILDAETEAIGRVRGVLPGWMIESGIADPDDDPYEVVALREKVLQDGDDTFRYYLMMRSLDDPETDPDSFSHSIDLDRDGWAALRLLCDRVLARLDHDAGVRHVEAELAAVGGAGKVPDSTPLDELLVKANELGLCEFTFSFDDRGQRWTCEIDQEVRYIGQTPAEALAEAMEIAKVNLLGMEEGEA